ncbi:outer membrane efflux protein [Sulfuricella denitrificans skB26]|uniref:Outer membrane efflux protein n=1 Tax=Sulfuricella denitrificans (strain DSM 22764 / NBRC 105220 / skB26) TaxID=1163617 RepID=S6ALU1_SULDS|nr:TolC family protein [Sulfuricella denitrificans]BAN35664.1 outer membrane efflux protein [Sulfuricella denitrificans skB26]
MKPHRYPIMPGKLHTFALVLALASASALAEPTASLPGANVENLLELARSQNPEFAAMRYEAEAAAERVYPAGALPDPTLRTELRDITNQGMDASPNLLPGRIGSTKYTLIQPVPFWGKRDLKQDVAEAQANQARGNASASWSDLAARIKVAYAQYYVQIHAEALTREILDLVGSLEKITQTRYANGLTPQQDVIRIQIERTGMRSELVAIGNERHHAMIKLNTLLNRSTMASLADPEYLRPIPSAAKLDHGALEERLRSRNPQLFVEEARVAAAGKNRDLVLRNRYPDFNLGLSPVQTGSKVSEWELMIELNIPLQQESRRSQEREAQAMLAAAESRRESVKNQLLADLSENIATLDTARYTEHLNSTSFLPQAELSYKAAMAGYETGKVDFAALLDAQRQIRKAKLDILKAQGEMQIGLAEIERLLGEDL